MKLIKLLPLLGVIAALGLPTCPRAASPPAAPHVVSSTPRTGAKDVDSGLKEISVTFDQSMQDGSWSWAYEKKEQFPTLAAQPHFTNKGRTCVLPVKLEAGHSYLIWINTQTLKNFKNTAGQPAVPYRLEFTTRK
jgi:hypothetical protein